MRQTEHGALPVVATGRSRSIQVSCRVEDDAAAGDDSVLPGEGVENRLHPSGSAVTHFEDEAISGAAAVGRSVEIAAGIGCQIDGGARAIAATGEAVQDDLLRL